eukprot:3080383-Rhodomonas_salina.1
MLQQWTRKSSRRCLIMNHDELHSKTSRPTKQTRASPTQLVSPATVRTPPPSSLPLHYPRQCSEPTRAALPMSACVLIISTFSGTQSCFSLHSSNRCDPKTLDTVLGHRTLLYVDKSAVSKLATGGSVACGGISRTATQGAIFRLNAGLNAGLRLRGGAGEDKIALSENENGGGEGADLNCTSPVLRAEGCLQRIPLQFILGTGAESEGSSVVVCGWAKTVCS